MMIPFAPPPGVEPGTTSLEDSSARPVLRAKWWAKPFCWLYQVFVDPIPAPQWDPVVERIVAAWTYHPIEPWNVHYLAHLAVREIRALQEGR